MFEYWITVARHSIVNTMLCFQKILLEQAAFFFVPMAAALANDESPKCRKLTALAIKSLMEKVCWFTVLSCYKYYSMNLLWENQMDHIDNYVTYCLLNYRPVLIEIPSQLSLRVSCQSLLIAYWQFISLPNQANIYLFHAQWNLQRPGFEREPEHPDAPALSLNQDDALKGVP